MPVYEYLCKACGATLEEIQPMWSPGPDVCSVCGGELRRVYGRVAIRFSGWGFDRTDGLVPGGRPRKNFKALRERAEEIADG